MAKAYFGIKRLKGGSASTYFYERNVYRLDLYRKLW